MYFNISILIIVSILFAGCSDKEKKVIDTNITTTNKIKIIKVEKKEKEDDLFENLLANSINSLEQLEKELDSAILLVDRITPDKNLSDATENYETKEKEYKEKLGKLIDVIYRLNNANIELRNQNRESKVKVVIKRDTKLDSKFKKLLNKYETLLANSKSDTVDVDIGEYQKKVNALKYKKRKEKVEERAAKSMFGEIEISE